ncbi:10120_t:CDS:2 [Entrophospora sp. SA101]|nr:10120_t:CDS:2 [Entrophospora sp. SA101]
MDHTITFALNKLSLNPAPASPTAANNFNSENRDGENAVTHESLGESPSALVKKFRNNPWVTKFINELAIQESVNPNVISALLQTIYYDGANSLAIPHTSYSQLPFVSKDIVRIIETWLTENFSRAGDSIPILGNTLEDNVESINQRLRAELDFSGLNKVLVNIRAGHSFFSHMEGDEIVLDKNQVEFFSRNN